MANEKPARKSNAGRPALPEDQKKHYGQPGLSLRPDQIVHLQDLAEALDITSRSGVNYGKPSWRTLIAVIAEAAPAVVEAIKARKADTERTFYPIRITAELTLTIQPTPDPELEAVKEEIKEDIAAHEGQIVRAGDMPVTSDAPPTTPEA